MTAAGPVTVLYALTVAGPRHDHTMRVVSVPFPDGEQFCVEVTEPRGCGCVRRVPISELVHLLVNISDAELTSIPNRTTDPAGHDHDSA